ncbi:MAG: nitrilase-related carbon-nitrogen hydrolase, partial [Dissulfurimicrobium sp.]
MDIIKQGIKNKVGRGSTINLGIFQFNPRPDTPWLNWKRVRTAIQRLRENGVDIILLPELWATGPLQPGMPLPLNELDEIRQEAQTLSKSLGVLIIGTLPTPCTDGARHNLYNETHVFGLDRPHHPYRKINLFQPMAEHKLFNEGHTPAVLWTRTNGLEIGIGLMTCYDLRFPELARQ